MPGDAIAIREIIKQHSLLMPGDAIAIREMTTCDMALRAACVDSPNLLPFSSNIGMPLVSSLVN